MSITPRFSDQTEQAIIQRVLSDISNDVDKRQGSVACDLTTPVAISLAEFYSKLDTTLSYAFINEDMPSDLLTLAAANYGVDRKSAIKSIGQVTLTGPESTQVPKGTRIRTDGGVYFVTLFDVVLAQGSAITSVEAVNGGASGNVPTGAINVVVGDLAGVVSVTNSVAFDGGVDEESDESLLQRVYDKVRKPATSGNAYHYEQWAREVAGVSDVKVIPVWNGPGTVKVVLLDENKQTPSPAIIDATTTYIEANRPIGANVTVVGANPVTVNVVASVSIPQGVLINEIEAEFNEKLTQYLSSIAFKNNALNDGPEPVRYAKVASLLLDIAQVSDYSGLTINGGSVNINVADEQVAVVGTVTLDVL